MFYIRRPSQERIRQVLNDCAEAGLTYPEVAATRGELPRPYAHNTWNEVIGHGRRDFDAAVRALRSFSHIRLHWVDLSPPDAVAEEGELACVNARALRLWALNPCKIVYVDEYEDESRAIFQFATGTLPGHAATGEERFSVIYTLADDTVRYDLASFSKPRHILAKLAFFYVRMKQRQFARGTAKALQAAVRSCAVE